MKTLASLFLAVFLFSAFYATAQRGPIKPADISVGNSSSTSNYSSNSKGTPAKIKDTYGIWTDFNLKTNSGASTLRSQIGDSKFNEIANNCNETSGWPGAISSYEERNKVRDQMVKYVCYQIAEIDDKYILHIPASENKFLPYGVRPEHDIYMMVRKTDVELTGSPTLPGNNSYSSSYSSPSSYTPVSNLKGPKAKVKDSFGIWTDFDLRSKADASKVKEKLGYALYEDVANYCNEKSWPSGISSYNDREKVRPEMKEYVCYQIGESDDKWILRVPAAENTFQPYNIRPVHDIYFMVRKSDVELYGTPINTLSNYSSNSSSGSSSSSTATSSYYNKSYPTKINATGGMYSTFNLLTESKAAYLKGYWGNTDFEYVAKYCKEENWPSGISSLSARDKVRAQMNNYKAYRIAEFDGKCILKIPADENKFMPYDMRPAQDIFFVINTTDVTVGGSATGSTSSSYKSTSTSSKTLSYSKDDIGKAVHIAQGATLMDDLESMDYYNESKEQMDATEYQNALKYSKRENWPSGISTKEARETNSAKIADYKGIIVAHFIDDYDLGSYVIKIAPKANSHMPSNMRPATTVYVLVDEYDVDLD